MCIRDRVSLVTRSGTNQLHGSVYEYNRNTLTAANNWFNKQAQAAAGEPNVAGKLIRNTFGAALGGPLKKDRLFYFLNYEGQRTAENQQETLTVPTASYAAGNVSYTSGGNNVTLTPAQIATMDPQDVYKRQSAYVGNNDLFRLLSVEDSAPLTGDPFSMEKQLWGFPRVSCEAW